jgi:hypothetical protein
MYVLMVGSGKYTRSWFGGLDLSRDCADPRTPFSGDKFSAVREVAKTDGAFSFRAPLGTESELKSPRSSAVNAVSPTGWWNFGCTLFEIDHLVEQYRNNIVGIWKISRRVLQS